MIPYLSLPRAGITGMYHPIKPEKINFFSIQSCYVNPKFLSGMVWFFFFFWHVCMCVFV